VTLRALWIFIVIYACSLAQATATKANFGSFSSGIFSVDAKGSVQLLAGDYSQALMQGSSVVGWVPGTPLISDSLLGSPARATSHVTVFFNVSNTFAAYASGSTIHFFLVPLNLKVTQAFTWLAGSGDTLLTPTPVGIFCMRGSLLGKYPYGSDASNPMSGVSFHSVVDLGIHPSLLRIQSDSLGNVKAAGVGSDGVSIFNGTTHVLPQGFPSGRKAIDLAFLSKSDTLFIADSQGDVWSCNSFACDSVTHVQTLRKLVASRQANGIQLDLLDASGRVHTELLGGFHNDVVWQSGMLDGSPVTDSWGNPLPLTTTENKWSFSTLGFLDHIGAEIQSLGYYHHAGGIQLLDLRVDPLRFSSKHHQYLNLAVNLLTSKISSVWWGLAADTNGKISSPTQVLDNRSSGMLFFQWDPHGSVPQGRAQLGMFASDGTDTVHLWTPVLFDSIAPVGVPVFSVQSQSLVSGSLMVGSAMPMVVHLNGVIDQPDTTETSFFRFQAWRGDTSNSTEWTRTWNGRGDSLVLNGQSQGNVPIASGTYHVRWRLEDLAGNMTPWVDSLQVGSTKYGTVEFNPLPAMVSAELLPMLVGAVTGGKATLGVDVVPRQTGSYVLRYFLDSQTVAVPTDAGALQPDSIGGLQGSEYHIDHALHFQALDSGLHSIGIYVRDSHGFESLVTVPFIYGKSKTKIYSPSLGQNVDAGVNVVGIVASGGFDASAFRAFRCYWTSGAVHLTSGKTLPELMSSASWHPMLVPLQSQLANTGSISLVAGVDQGYPNSNLGNHELLTNGVLARFVPNGSDSLYTLLVVSEFTANGFVQWDYDQVIVTSKATSPVGSVPLTLKLDRNKIDLTDSLKSNDSAVVTISDSGATDGWITLSLQSGKSVQSFSANVVYQDKIPFSQGHSSHAVLAGKDFQGRYLPTGTYTLVAEYAGQNGAMTQASDTIRIDVPAVLSTSSALNVFPQTVLFQSAPSAGNEAQIQVRLDRMLHYGLNIERNGLVVKRLATNEFGDVADYAYDLTDSLGNVLPLLSTDTMMTFVAVLYSTDSLNFFPDIRVSFNVAKVGVLTNLPPLLALDSSSAQDPKTGFRFRGIAQGPISYFPKRLLNFTTSVLGKQRLKRYLDVPYQLDYRKFYNSVEMIASDYYMLHQRTCIFDCDHYDKPAGPITWRYSFYALSKFDRPWADSISTSQPLQVNAAKPWFGDTALWSLSHEKPEFNLQPPNGEDSLRKYPNPILIKRDWPSASFAKSPLIHQDDHTGDDEWISEVSDGYLNLFFMKKLACASNRIALDTTSFTSIITTGIGKSMTFTEVKIPTYVGEDTTTGFRIDGSAEQAKDLFGALTYTLSFKNKNGNIPSYPSPSLTNSLFLTEYPDSSGKLTTIEWPGKTVFQPSKDGAPKRWNFSYDNFGTDNLTTSAYTTRPLLNWQHDYLQLQGQVSGSLNAGRLAKAPNSNVFEDNVPWDGESGQSCKSYTKTPYITGGAKDASSVIDSVCSTSHGGAKHGLPGFVYRNAQVYTNRFGVTLQPQQVIRNFYDRSDSGHVHWITPTYRVSGNKYQCLISSDTAALTDNLRFRPALETDSLYALGVTWDTTTVLFPWGAGEADSLFEDDGTGKAFAYRGPLDKLTQSNMMDHWDVVVAKGHSAAAVRSLPYVDTLRYDLNLRYDSLFKVLDSSSAILSKGKIYGFINSSSLQFSANLSSKELDANGSILQDSAFNDANNYLQAKDSVINGHHWLSVYYLNKPIHLANWSSRSDSALKKTDGYLYGSGNVNRQSFLSRDNGLDTGTSRGSGFLAQVNARGLSFPSSSTYSLSPFQLDSNKKLVYNPNLVADSLHWNLELFQWDGTTANAALQVVSSDTANVRLELSSQATLQSYVPIPGHIDSIVTSGSNRYKFKYFQLYWNPDPKDTKGPRPIAVNRFYSLPNTSIYDGEILPKVETDLWSTIGDTVPVLGYWNVTGLNGKYRVWLDVVYQSLSADSALVSRVDSREMVVGKALASGSSTLVAVTQERRAQITFPASQVSDGAVVSISTVAPSEVTNLNGMPDVVPLGPVIKLQTTGRRVFDAGQEPTLQYRIAARELYSMRHLTGFDTASLSSIVAFVNSEKGNFSIHLLNDSGQIQDLPSLVSVDSNGQDREAIAMVLSASVPHFSYAMVLPKDSHDGVPAIDSVSMLTDTIVVYGRYSTTLVPDSIPLDLELSLSTNSSLLDSTKVFWKQFPVLVDSHGKFRVAILRTKVGSGDRYVFARYRGASLAARRLILVDDGVWNIDQWTDATGNTNPVCGVPLYQAFFQSDEKGSVQRLLLDSTGMIRASEIFDVASGENQNSWDGCLSGYPLPKGLWKLEYHFVNGPVVLRNVGILRKVANVVSASVRYPVFVPSASNSSHLQTLSVVSQNMNTETLGAVLLGPNGDTLQKLTADKGVAQTNGSSLQTFLWNGLTNAGKVYAPGQYRWGVGFMNAGVQPALWASFRLDSIGDDAGIGFEVKQTLSAPVSMVPVTLRNGIPVTVQIALVGADNQNHFVALQDSSFVSGERLLSVPWTNSGAPKLVRLWWNSSSGSGGYAEAAIHVLDSMPKLGNISFSGDSIYPELTPDWVSRLGGTFASVASVGFSAQGSGTATLEARNDSQQVVFRSSVAVADNIGRLSWNGSLLASDSLVEDGVYHLRLSVSSPLGSSSAVVDTFATYVVRFPDAAIAVRDNAPNSVRSFALRVQDSLRALGVRRVGILNEAQTQVFMALQATHDQKGLVVFVEPVVPPSLFHGDPRNSVFMGFQAGVHFAFFGAQPLRQYWNGGVPVDAPGVALPLFGLADSYLPNASLASLDTTLFVKKIALGGIDTSYAVMLHNISSRRSAGLLPVAEAVKQNGFLLHAGNQAIFLDSAMVGGSRLRLDALYHPILNPVSGPQSSFLVYNPYGADTSAAMAGDYATAIERLFFKPDLSTNPGLVHFRSDRKDSTAVARGSKMTWTVDYRLLAKDTTHSKLYISIPGNAGYRDSVNVHADPYIQSNNRVTLLVPIDSTAVFDTALAKISFAPIAQELDLANNSVTVPFVIRDTATPVVNWGTGDTLPGYLSTRTEGFVYQLKGSVDTRHKLGEVQVSLSIGTLVLHDSVSADKGLFTFSIPPQPIPFFTAVRVTLVATDKYGNATTSTKIMRLDGNAPVIDSLIVVNKVGGDSTYFVIGKGNPVVRVVAHDNKTLRSVIMRQTGVVYSDSGLPGNQYVHQSALGLDPGDLLVEVRDSAGNLARRTITLSIDTTHPVVSVYRVLAPSWPHWSDTMIQNLDSASLASKVNHLRFYPTVHQAIGNSTDTLSVANPDSAWRINSATAGNWTETFNAAGMDSIRLVVAISEANPQGEPVVTVDGTAFQHLLQGQPISTALLPLLQHDPLMRYIALPVKKGQTQLDVQVSDKAGNITHAILNIVNPVARMAARDAKGDTTAAGGQDFGEVYAARHDSVGNATLDFLIHSWNNGFADKDLSTWIYLDLDGDSTTGYRGVTLPGGRVLNGFERRIHLAKIDSRDGDYNNLVEMQSWNGTAWASIRSVVGAARAADLEMEANQTDLFWSPEVGEGSLVLPSGTVAGVPGGAVTIRAVVPTHADSIRWVIVADQDAVFDTVAKDGFYLKAGSAHTLGAGMVADWWDGAIPTQMSVTRYSSQAEMEQVDTAHALLKLRLQNLGLAVLSELKVKIKMTLPTGCAAPVVVPATPPGEPWWMELPNPGDAPGTLVLRLDSHALTAGSTWELPAVILSGCGLNGASWSVLPLETKIDGAQQ